MVCFHLAIPVNDLAHARRFYGEILGCEEGRSAERWTDFSFFGHQLTVHLQEGEGVQTTNPVDGDNVPIPHFGVILTIPAWEGLSERLREAGMTFLIEPRYRFRGEKGEQATFFIKDPSGNALEFKAFQEPSRLFEG